MVKMFILAATGAFGVEFVGNLIMWYGKQDGCLRGIDILVYLGLFLFGAYILTWGPAL